MEWGNPRKNLKSLKSEKGKRKPLLVRGSL